MWIINRWVNLLFLQYLSLKRFSENCDQCFGCFWHGARFLYWIPENSTHFVLFFALGINEWWRKVFKRNFENATHFAESWVGLRPRSKGCNLWINWLFWGLISFKRFYEKCVHSMGESFGGERYLYEFPENATHFLSNRVPCQVKNAYWTPIGK